MVHKKAVLIFFLILLASSACALSINAEVDPVNLIEETNENNLFSYTVGELTETGTIGITFAPVYLEDKDTYIDTVEESLDFIKSTYPFSENGVVTRIVKEPRKPTLFGIPYEGTDPIDIQAIVISLWTEFRLMGADLVPDQNPIYPDNVIVGIVPYGFFGGKMSGVSSLVIRNTVLIEPGGRPVAAHEIGHIYELCEEYDAIPYWLEFGLFGGCGNAFPTCHKIKIGLQTYCAGNRDTNGFWISEEKPIYPFNRNYFGTIENLQETKWGVETYNDATCTEIENADEEYKMTCTFYYYNFMGVPPVSSEWVSKETYAYLLSIFENPGAMLIKSTEFQQLNSSSSQSLLVSGLVDRNGWIGLQDWYLIPAVQQEEIPSGPYSIRLLDAGNNVLGETPFAVSFALLSDPPMDLNTSGFAFTIPFVEGTKKIEVTYNGETKAEKAVSNNAPIVSIVSPKGSEKWNGVRTIDWTASDADHDELSFVLQYSSDDGVTWNPIAINLNETSYDLNFGVLEPAGTYRVKVIATDGVLVGADVSNRFTVLPQGPIGLDSDGDGVNDAVDKCPDTTGLQEAYGCSCRQILDLKPGEDEGELKNGCSAGTIEVFKKQIGWAEGCCLNRLIEKKSQQAHKN